MAAAAAGYAAGCGADVDDADTASAAAAAAADMCCCWEEVGRPAVAAWMSAWIAVISGAPDVVGAAMVRDGFFCEVTADGGWDCAWGVPNVVFHCL